MQQRPAGVIVLGVLAIIWGILGLCGGTVLLLGDHILARQIVVRVGELVGFLAASSSASP